MSFSSLLRLSNLAVTRFWRILFVLMLVMLHMASLRGGEDAWARALMLAHFGLFITWQPFMRGEQRVSLLQTGVIALVAIGTMLFFNWWLLALWVSILAGIVGGKVFLFRAPWLRRFYLIVLAYLVCLLLFWIVPGGVVKTALPPEVEIFARFGLPVLFITLAVMPAEPDSAETPQVIDFFYATMLFLLLVVLILGAFAFMQIGHVAYAQALMFSLLVLAAVLLTLSVVWNPRAGFNGLSMYFSRYLLSIGMPFEQWLFILAELSQIESKPERFMKEATQGLARLPWVTGGFWQTGTETGEFGDVSKNSVEYTNQEMHLRVFTRERLSPSLAWHFHLLGQLLGEFYIAKLREQTLQQQTYIQAVHETGARMTHDVKNLLQSLNVLCAAAEHARTPDSGELTALIRRQLPAITQRLQQTMDKLQKPQTESGRFVQAGAWWDSLQRSYQNRGIDFVGENISSGILLPKELMDSTADNLLQNALAKRKMEPAITISVSFECTANGVRFSVVDSGAAVDAEVLRGLLRGPVPSKGGFGIGLYQTARMAEQAGYSLRLTANEPGRVCLTLAGEMPLTGADQKNT